MIPLSLVTGFLGGGKTTLLQRLIEQNQGRRLAYIVNEFAEADVDGQLLELGEDQVVSIPGGSIFCRCLSGEFLRVLQEIPERFDAPTSPLEGVVIEASGIADPRVTVSMLAETRLDRVYELRTVVSVIDPGTFLKLIHTLPNVIAQVKACDVALVNKTDLHDEDAIGRAEQEIERINPQARIVRTAYCRSEFDILAASQRGPMEGEYALCRDPNYESVTLTLEHAIDPAPLMAGLERIKDRVYRAKGFVPVAEGTLYVDVATGRLTERVMSVTAGETHPAGEGAGRLVFIFDPQSSEEVEGLIAELRSSVCVESPSS